MVKSESDHLGEAIVKTTLGLKQTIGVLQIDGDLVFLKEAKAVLEAKGEFEVCTVLSVKDAFRRLEKGQYDVIVSDYQIPGKDGLQFLRELREGGNAIPFIVFTGKGREEVAVKALNLGADGYFNKIGAPETVYGELAHGIRQAVARRMVEEALRRSQAEYKSLSQNIPGMIYRGKPSDWSVEIISRSEEVCGYPSEDFVSGKASWLGLIFPQDKKRVLEEASEITRKPMSIVQVYRIIHKDAGVRWVEDHKTSIFSANGVFEGTDGVVFDISERKKIEQEQERLLGEVGERVKELRCLYGMSRLVEEPGIALEKIVVGTVNLLPPAYQYPSITCARIFLESQEFATENFRETQWKQQVEIIVNKEKVGFVQVCYLEEKPTIGEGPFLRGESDLINAIAERLGRIIERMKNEKVILENQQKFEKLFNGIPQAVVYVDQDVRVLNVNPRFTQFFGHSLDEVKGRFLDDFLVPEDRKKEALMLTQKAKEGYVYYETVRKNKEGFLIPVALSAAPIMLQDQHVGDIVLYQDIAERKKIEDRFKESEERLKGIIDSSSDYILLLDRDCKILSINKVAADVRGKSPKELVGTSAFEAFPETTAAQFSENIKNVFDTGNSMSMDEKVFVKGRELYNNTSLNPVRDDKGRVIAVAGIVRDITERKKTEKELKRSRDKLKMMNEKLLVIGSLSRHDVRNKLTAVAGNVYLMREKLAGDSEVLDYLKQIEKSVEETVKILEFAKAYEMLGVEELVYVDVEKAFDEAVSLFSSLRDVKVVNDCRGLTVLADSLLRTLFYNLVDNSLKYGEKLSRIRVFYEEENGGLKVIYEDDGVGIPEAVKPKLFNAGYTTGKGSGYGLYLIKKMMEVYGWTIVETGEPRRGAQFVIAIPKTNLKGNPNYQVLRCRQASEAH